MAWNIIVTCGTSQIEGRKLHCIANMNIRAEGLEQMSTEEEYQKLGRLDSYAEGLLKPNGVDIDETYFQQVIGESKQLGGNPTEQEEYCQILVDALVNRWYAIGDKIGTNQNPFGAEISTLYVLKKQFKENETPLDGQRDRIVLLYSQTESGAFCAGVIYHLLPKLLGFRNIEAKLVKELAEEPKEAEKALQYLVHQVADSCRSGFHDIFIVTGGYKYMSSTVGLVAQMMNLPHYYLFEYSKIAYDLTLKVDLIPDYSKTKIQENLMAVKEKRVTAEHANIPFILRHPEHPTQLNRLGEILCERWEPKPDVLDKQVNYGK